MKSVLIIDDDPLIRKTLSGHLAKQGFDVQMAEEGEEGVKKFREFNPDLVILDVRLGSDQRPQQEDLRADDDGL
jgi:DNA-binding response OmpR family regulator